MEKAVNLIELKAVAIALLDSLISASAERAIPIDANADFYWEVPSESIYRVKDTQPQLDVGRLSDDWDFIRSLASNPDDATPFALIHLAPILRFIAESTSRG